MSSAIEWETTVLVLVAVSDELMGVVGELSKSGFLEGFNDSTLANVFYFQERGVLVKVLLAKLPHPSQGGDAAAWFATTLAERYKPYCLAMIGLCAGNPKLLSYGDVAVASSTVRHDFGKIDKKVDQPEVFTHRPTQARIERSLCTSLLTFLAKQYELAGKNATLIASSKGFKVGFGVMSTGNQVIKIPDAFSYLEREVGPKLSGDEHDRKIVALEMEAHAIAYAAQESDVPLWMVVKGVSDYADPGKEASESQRPMAVTNAYSVTIDILRKVVVELYLKEPDRQVATEEERESAKAWHNGALRRAKDSAEHAYALGRRSPETRRRYLRSLTQFGECRTVRCIIDAQRTLPFYYDPMTIEMEATILWREGRYRDVCELLTDKVIQKQRQLMYLRAVSELLMRERGWAIEDRSNLHLKKAKDLLEKSLRTDAKRPSPWWILVNLFWVNRLLGVDKTIIERELGRAKDVLYTAIDEASRRGSPRLYLLLLLAIADRRDDFDATLKTYPSDIEVSLELVDMVYERLAVMQRRKLLQGDSLSHYWGGIREWLRNAMVVGRPTRESNEARLR